MNATEQGLPLATVTKYKIGLLVFLFLLFSRFVSQTAPVEFSVKWKNYPETANTWEPLENLSGCMRLVCKFLMHMGSQMVPEAPMISGALSASSFPAILV